MAQEKWQRRKLLQTAGTAVVGLPLASLVPASVVAQSSGKQTGVGTAAAGQKQTNSVRANVRIDVRELGATGDGKTRDTVAVQQALDRCAVLGGGEVVVPAGEYVCGALRVHSNTALRVEEGASLNGSPDIADYPFTQVRWEGRWIKGYSAFVSAQDAENVTISGKGKIVASAAIKGRVVHADGSPMVYGRAPAGPPARGESATAGPAAEILRNPALLEFTRCKNVLVEDVFTQGNDMWSTHPVYCENVTFRNVVVHSGADGIDVDSCKGVVIEGCEFVTRDDCISLKSGRGMEGHAIGVPCEDVRISNCTFNDAVWACIGIGSETSGGIRNVHVEHCRCVGARTFAIYIKSRPGRGAFLEDIYVDDFEVSGAGQGFLRFNLLNSGLQDPNPVPGEDGIPTIRDFHFSNIRVKDVPVLVDGASIHPHKPLEGFSLTNVTGTCGKGIMLANIRGAVLRDISVTGFAGPLLSVWNVTGKGLDGAAALPEVETPKPIEAGAAAFLLK